MEPVKTITLENLNAIERHLQSMAVRLEELDRYLEVQQDLLEKEALAKAKKRRPQDDKRTNMPSYAVRKLVVRAMSSNGYQHLQELGEAMGVSGAAVGYWLAGTTKPVQAHIKKLKAMIR